jgi:hypothetical protein
VNHDEPAFPVNFANDTEWDMEDPFGRSIPEHSNSQYTGITKRDYFAAKAMQEFIRNDQEHSFSAAASFSYRMADAMIKESNND